MRASRNIDSWEQVDSREDFSSWLRFLAFDCEQAHSGGTSGVSAALEWTHQSIDGFLWGWVRLLGSRLDGTDLLHEEAPGRPGWRGLAHQLDRVRTTLPGYNDVLADSGTRHEEVDTPGDLSMYAAALAMDFVRDRREMQAKAGRGEWAGDGGSWAHGTLYDWLASWGSWVGADSPRHAQLTPVTWRCVALQLSVARIYE
ncbi:hypothetical protein [Streptomyces yaizuensis]|uniref:Uncharacterized protein n=1 Tax=Streptomyces yaizuensis TaxID=2989713 RepID=A0ABQ5PA28_9ACTN|nr:hypothetical protein [Streptomyces sp. YSPA8]GLF99444.1 hypothetical protein SYYSPA8_34125 [Streptomyces sp. YSPA8]